MPNSPNSNVKKPKTLIFIDESNITKNGKINDTKMSILLVLLSNNFCNSKFKSRNILVSFCYQLIVKIALLNFLYVVLSALILYLVQKYIY